jgi:hypothetical protein
MLKRRLIKRLAVTVAAVLVFVAVGLAGFNAFQRQDLAKAGGVTPTITPSAANVSTALNAGNTLNVAYTTSIALPAASTIKLTYNSGYTGSVTTSNSTINTVAPATATSATSGGNTTVTFTTASAISSGATVTIATTGLTSPSTAGNYVFSILSGNNGQDYGANFQYVGQYNLVQVTAFIPVTLSFSIRNTADTADTNICDLGTVSTASVASCSYRLKVTTNATSGYTISISADGGLTNGTSTVTNAAAGPTGTNLTAGIEAYGATVNAGSITGSAGTISLASSYQNGGSNATAYNNTSPAVLLTANKPNSPSGSGDTTNTSLITHKLAISNNTSAGYYTQRVTYTVTPSF